MPPTAQHHSSSLHQAHVLLSSPSQTASKKIYCRLDGLRISLNSSRPWERVARTTSCLTRHPSEGHEGRTIFESAVRVFAHKFANSRYCFPHFWMIKKQTEKATLSQVKTTKQIMNRNWRCNSKLIGGRYMTFIFRPAFYSQSLKARGLRADYLNCQTVTELQKVTVQFRIVARLSYFFNHHSPC